MDERTKEYGEWMVVTRRKSTSKAKMSHQTQTTSQESETSQWHIGKRSFRVDDLSKKDGKWKVPSPSTLRSQRTADKTARPFPRKDGVKPDFMNMKLHETTVKQGRHLVQSQRNKVGPSNYEPMFSFGESQTYEGPSGLSPTPLIFSSPISSPSKVSILKPKIRDVALGVHKNGDHK